MINIPINPSNRPAPVDHRKTEQVRPTAPVDTKVAPKSKPVKKFVERRKGDRRNQRDAARGAYDMRTGKDRRKSGRRYPPIHTKA